LLSPLYLQAQPEKQELIISHSASWKPYSYIEAGEPKGLLIDYWLLYSKVSGVNVRFILADWQESLDNVVHERADLHAGLLSSKQREELFYFGKEIINLQAALYVTKELSKDLKGDISQVETPVGVVSGGYEEYFLKKKYPSLILVAFPNNGVMYNAAKSGHLKSFVTDTQVANFYLNNQDKSTNYFIPYKVIFEQPIRYAVKKGNEELLNTLHGHVKLITEYDLHNIKEKWTNAAPTIDVWLKQALVVGVILFFISYVYLLKKLVSHRTKILAVQNKKLQKEANTDVLTGLFNRRYLMAKVNSLSIESKKHSFAFLMVDIDYFKRINDEYGHHIGDKALKVIAERLSASIRKQDTLARIGGEEFCIILDIQSFEDAIKIAQKINNNISSHPCKHENNIFNITVSIGCSFIKKNRVWQGSTLLKHADELLYQSKSNGRNQVTSENYA
jgi:diguanylate cyclase (GGDEF)-like protein